MPRYRATLAYDGTAYFGFQRQRNVSTIQQRLEDAIQRATGQSVTVIGAGRTDTGVHARGQVVAFDVAWNHPDEALLRAINAHLPEDIAIHTICQHEGFHPRFDALSRTYRYTVLNAPYRHPLWRYTAWQVRGDIDITKLQTVALMLIGEHDFGAFGHPPQGDNTIRRVMVSQWTASQVIDGRLLVYEVEANAFLYHMVRRMVGAQMAVGRGLLSVAEFADIFHTQALDKIKTIAPPQGLVLEKVRYPEDNE